MAFTEEEIKDIFTYHAPHGNQQERYQSIREAAFVFAMILVTNSKPSADQTAAIRKLRECVMTVNASIALEKE